MFLRLRFFAFAPVLLLALGQQPLDHLVVTGSGFAFGQAHPAIAVGQDLCGDPRKVSQVYALCDATVKEVVDGQTVVVEFDRPCPMRPASRPVKGRQRVRLAQLDAPPISSSLGADSRSMLARRVLGRSVEVLPSPFQDRGDLIAILTGPGGDQSALQLEAGLAKYRDLGPYAVDWYLACVYERAQESARTKALGVWAQH
jgi:endonuclease YncB( thermonuclease family)